MFTALLGKLIYIQIISSEKLQVRALDQWMRDVPLVAERGEIYDKNGIVLADSKTSYTVYVRPIAVEDKQLTAKALSSVLNLDYDTVYQKTISKKSEMTILKGVSKEQMLALLETGATGVYYSQNIDRVYPYGDFMTQVLGFTDYDVYGQTGIESRYDQYLRGVNGYILTESDLVGRELEHGTTYYVEGKKGYNACLTLDYYIQSFAESAVKKARLNHNAKSASCIIMDVNTGEIAAIAQAPSFDLNNVPRDNLNDLFTLSKSSLVSNVFEPGSTFKILTAAIGLETGAINLNTRVYCTGSHIVDGQRIRCWKTAGHGSQSFVEGVRNSCNVLFMNTALAIGSDTFYDYISKFGLTEKTGVDISGEASGLTIPLASVKNVDLARIGFGQAIAVTPIELLRSTAAVVNGGKMVTPYVLDRFVDDDGKTVYKNYPNVKSGVISEKTSKTMREVLESVVSEGSGRNAAVAGYRIGGKTGTAQKYENGSIAGGKYVSTFIGFAPADNPKYIALMIVDEPQGLYYGSIVAAPYVGEIFGNIFNYEGLPPAETAAKKQFVMPDLIGLGVSEAAAILKMHKLYYETEGDGAIVTYQLPAAGTTVNEDIVAYIELH